MDKPTEIGNLKERRRLILAESERLRCQLGTEIGQFRAATVWIKTDCSLLQSVRVCWPLVVAGAGFLIARKRGGLLRSLVRIWSVWDMAKKLVLGWQQFSTELSPSEHER